MSESPDSDNQRFFEIYETIVSMQDDNEYLEEHYQMFRERSTDSNLICERAILAQRQTLKNLVNVAKLKAELKKRETKI